MEMAASSRSLLQQNVIYSYEALTITKKQNKKKKKEILASRIFEVSQLSLSIYRCNTRTRIQLRETSTCGR